MRRTIAAVGLVGLGLLGTTLPAIATPDNGQVTVCHETGSETNPIIEIDVNEDAPASNGNGGNGGNNGNGNGGNSGNNGNARRRRGECYPDNEEPPMRSHLPRNRLPRNRRPRSSLLLGAPVVAPPVVAPPAVVVPEAPVVKPW